MFTASQFICLRCEILFDWRFAFKRAYDNHDVFGRQIAQINQFYLSKFE